LLDWYFLLGFAMILNDTGRAGSAGSDRLFPSYYQHAERDEQSRQQKKSSSKVSEYFKNQFVKVLDLFTKFTEGMDNQDEQEAANDTGGGQYYAHLSLNPGISSHSPKRFPNASLSTWPICVPL
jgi:hypothetical protein